MPLIETGLVLLGKAVSSKLLAAGAGSLAAAGVVKAGSAVVGKAAAAGAAKVVATQARAAVTAKLGPAAGVKTVGGKVLEKGTAKALEHVFDKAQALAKDALVSPERDAATADDNVPKAESGEQPSRADSTHSA